MVVVVINVKPGRVEHPIPTGLGTCCLKQYFVSAGWHVDGLLLLLNCLLNLLGACSHRRCRAHSRRGLSLGPRHPAHTMCSDTPANCARCPTGRPTYQLAAVGLPTRFCRPACELPSYWGELQLLALSKTSAPRNLRHVPVSGTPPDLLLLKSSRLNFPRAHERTRLSTRTRAPASKYVDRRRIRINHTRPSVLL